MYRDSVKAAVRELRAIQEAEREVSHVVGPILGMDSATAVYGEACKRLGIDTRRVAPAGMVDVFRAYRSSGTKPALAQDAASRASFDRMFPEANRIGISGAYQSVR